MPDLNNKQQTAIKREKAERRFEAHLGIYLIVNAMLAGIRALSGARRALAVRTMLWWGIGLAYHGWTVYRKKPTQEHEVAAKPMGAGTENGGGRGSAER